MAEIGHRRAAGGTRHRPARIAKHAQARSSGMRFVALTPELLRLLPLRDPRAAGWMTEGYIAAACAPGLGWAALEGGYILGAGGLVPLWYGRALT